MLGQIQYRAGARGKVTLERVDLMGLRVLRAQWDPDSFWASWRLQKVGKLLHRAGVLRVLAPEDFLYWQDLGRFGLREVDPTPFLRDHAAPLAVAALERRGARPERCAVALRGSRRSRELVKTAHELSRRVREVCISVPGAGEGLERDLRREYGMAVRPDWPEVPAAVRFDAATDRSGGAVLSLFQPEPDLAGVKVGWKGGDLGGETDRLPLLCALWEAGKVGLDTLEFT